MFRNDDVPSWYSEDYKTLHHDIGLVRRSNGTWDLWFGQDRISEQYRNVDFLKIIDGDIVSATEVHSLQVGIIIACLTSWNYLNGTGNPIYTEFGNESYSLLKANKGVNTRYKIKQFFIDCLNRMRRVYSVESLEVYDVVNNPHLYKVIFKVISVTNTLVDGEFYLDTDTNKNTSILEIEYNHPYTSVANPLYIECTLKNEYASVIEGEIIYIYIRNDDNSKFKFYGITQATNNKGKVSITIPPKGLNNTTQIMLVFKGNSLYNPSTSKIINIESVAYYFKSYYDDNGKEILYVEDSTGRSMDKFRLGELLSDYIDLSKISLSDELLISDIKQYYVSDEKLVYSEDVINKKDNYKLYLIPTEYIIEGTNKKYYNAYRWVNKDKLELTNYKIQLNTDNPYETHFLINDGDNGYFEIDFEDGHLYYKTNFVEDEKY